MTDDPVRLFELPNTLAGDTAVTIVVQTIVTWLIEMSVVNRDLRKGNVQPIGFIPEPPPTGEPWWRAVRWLMLLDPAKQQRERRGSPWRELRYLLAQVARAFVLSVLCFCVLFGPCVGVLRTVGVRHGDDWDFAPRWAPQVFKLTLGGLLAVVTSPFFAMFWMVRCGWDGGIREAILVSGDGSR